MNQVIDEPLERLRTASRRTRDLALNRARTGLGHQDADDDIGTIGTDDALEGTPDDLCYYGSYWFRRGCGGWWALAVQFFPDEQMERLRSYPDMGCR